MLRKRRVVDSHAGKNSYHHARVPSGLNWAVKSLVTSKRKDGSQASSVVQQSALRAEKVGLIKGWIEALLQYLEEHPEVARGFPKLPAAKNKIKRQWEQLAPRLNSIGKSVKTWQQWTKYWADKKLSVKRKAALRDAAVKNGSDPDLVMELSDLERHILALASREYAVDSRPSRTISCDNPCSEIDVSNTSGTELVMENSEVVLLVSPATLMQEASPQPRSPPGTPSRSPSPAPAPSPPLRQESYRRSKSFTPAASSPPSYRYTEPKHRRRGRSEQPPAVEPTTQRRSHLVSLTERFLGLEEQRLELERRNTNILETMAGVAGQLMERDFERERVFARALQTVGDGLRLLADALRRSEPGD